MFKKFAKEIAYASDGDALENVLYRDDGVDIMYQKGKLSWDEHEILFKMAAMHRYSYSSAELALMA